MSKIPILDGPSLAPGAGGAPREIILLLHGYGSNGADLLGLAPFWRRSRPHALFLAPNAPERCAGVPGGYQWWGLNELSRAAVAAGAARATPALDGYIDAQLAAYGIGEDRLVLVGFSQGTMMALQVGPRRERQIAGIVGYSGMLADTGGLAREVRSKPPILLVHGSADSVLPAMFFHEAKAELHRLGFTVESHLMPGLDHTVDETGLKLGERFVRKALDGD